MKAGLPARRAAYDVLSEVFILHAPLDEALETAKTFGALEGQDRAFARMLISTVLRHALLLDKIWRPCLKNPKEATEISLDILMRMGVAQLFLMEVGAHAAVDGCVTLAAQVGQVRKKGLVNAILRNLERKRKSVEQHWPAAEAAFPDWLYQSWNKAYGRDAAKDLFAACLQEAPLDLTLKNSAAASEWAEKLGAEALDSDTLRLPYKDVSSLPGYAEGHWWVQDHAAAQAVRFLAENNDLSGTHIADLCAAPGGKTLQLMARDAKVTSVDKSPLRLKRLEENVARIFPGKKGDVIAADLFTWTPPALFDHILLDAPCSATGTIRRHPDILHLKTEEDVRRLSKLQVTLLERASAMLNPGGTLLYCTCSLQPEEGEDQVRAFLKFHKDFKLDGQKRLLPSALPGGQDGFFMAKLRKES